MDSADADADAAASADSSRDGAAADVGVAEAQATDASATGPMVLISRDVPAFGSTEATPASYANDNATSASCCGSEASNWSSSAIPAWLAYDLSGVPSAQRAEIVIAWYTFGTATIFESEAGSGSFNPPVTYVLEGNSAAGGTAAPPSDGWQTLTLHDHPPLAADGSITTVNGDTAVGANVHWADFAGFNWIRMRVLTVRSGDSVSLDMDVYSAPDGPTDSWLFMGDSITHISLMRGESGMTTIPLLVEAQLPTHFPAMIEYGIGGDQAGDAVTELPAVLQWFAGKYITLNFGTNQSATAQDYSSSMETAVQAILAAGHVPVIPTIPFPNTDDTQNMAVQMENTQIAALEVKYPQILPGPDLWTLFMMHPEYTTGTAPHPNSVGQPAYVAAWADWMATNVDTK